MILSLLFPIFALASDWKQVWEVSVPGKPAAAFFHVATGQIYVSTALPKGKMAVYQISPEGKLEADPVLEGKGEPGAMRSRDDRIFLVAGNDIVSFSPGGGSLLKEESLKERAQDLAFDSKGNLYVAGAFGVRKGTTPIATGLVTGLFFLSGDLHFLEKGKSLRRTGKSQSEKICEGGCQGLELSSLWGWITVKGNSVLSSKKGVIVANVTGDHSAGRLGYVYRREPKEDLVILPLPEAGKVRAYRAP